MARRDVVLVRFEEVHGAKEVVQFRAPRPFKMGVFLEPLLRAVKLSRPKHMSNSGPLMLKKASAKLLAIKKEAGHSMTRFIEVPEI